MIQVHQSKQDYLMPEAKTRRSTAVHSDLLSIVKNHFFTQKHCLGCGQWALECRDRNRRSAIYDMRIEEAREYLDFCLAAFQKLTHISRTIKYSKTIDQKTRALQEIVSLMDIAGKKEFRIDALNDTVLRDLNKKLRALLQRVQDMFIERISSDNDFVEKMSEEHNKAFAFVSEMQVQLDKLAQTIPLNSHCPLGRFSA